MYDKPAELVFLVFILPSLFAMSLMAEGVYKISKNLSGWFNIFLGFAFLISALLGYIILLR